MCDRKCWHILLENLAYAARVESWEHCYCIGSEINLKHLTPPEEELVPLANCFVPFDFVLSLDVDADDGFEEGGGGGLSAAALLLWSSSALSMTSVAAATGAAGAAAALELDASLAVAAADSLVSDML